MPEEQADIADVVARARGMMLPDAPSVRPVNPGLRLIFFHPEDRLLRIS